MAHGSKKWIVDATGRLKKSSDRTKKDYYSAVKYWDEDLQHTRWGSGRLRHRVTKSVCPQCRHVEKPILVERNAYWEISDALYAEYNELYGEAVNQWAEYNRWRWMFDRYSVIVNADDVVKVAPRPKMTQPPIFHDWVGNRKPEPLWNYHVTSLLCFKHERMYEQKRKMWWNNPHGQKANYQYTVYKERRDFRNDTKILLQKAKYDEKYYDDIPKKRVRGWLD